MQRWQYDIAVAALRRILTVPPSQAGLVAAAALVEMQESTSAVEHEHSEPLESADDCFIVPRETP